MSKRSINEKFLNTYIELDKLCCEKFGVASNGVTEYINRLNNARFAPNRDEVLPNLVKYRNLRNRFAHEPEAIRKADDISKADIKWVADLKKTVEGKKDPISQYLKKAKKFAKNQKAAKFFKVLLVLGVAALAVIAVDAFNVVDLGIV